MSNSDRFLKAFTVLEKWLRSITESDRGVPFSRLVDLAARFDGGVGRFRDELREVADLRNAIVHERTDGHVIAEPNARAVQDIERLRALLTDPPRVIPLFGKEVASAESDWPIAQAVALMNSRKFSQLPVRRSGDFLGLLTTNTVTRWLGAKAKDDRIRLTKVTVREVLGHTEDQQNHSFLEAAASVFRALEEFDEFEQRGKRLEAILITPHGQPGGKFLGIITVYDIPKIFGAHGIKKPKRQAG